ncbi:MAG TPA: hypothetical protein VH062_10505 [Polyangiaceae bacterium]|nr:hypothetical protein [Polyangiaceae bacterium]
MESVLEPTGIPVAVNSVTTALRMARSLFERPLTMIDTLIRLGPLVNARFDSPDRAAGAEVGAG